MDIRPNSGGYKEQPMKKNLFIVSFCYHGLLGGDIIADDNAITYKTGKLTIPARLRNLEMKYTDIAGITEDRALFLPAVTIHMRSGESYKFVVFFARRRFCELLRSHGVM